MHVEFSGNCLKQDKTTLNHGKIVNIYIAYELKSNLNDFGLFVENCLLGTIHVLKAIKTPKNNDNDYGQGYGIAFDSKGSFSYRAGGIGQNVIIFGVDMSSSVHANNKKRPILILGEEITQIGVTLYAEKTYSINFTATKKKSV